MQSKVFVKNYAAPPLDEKEVLRYAGHRGELSAQMQTALNECVKESENAFSYRVCYLTVDAADLEKKWGKCGALFRNRMQGARYAILFAATVGLGIDRLILQKESVSPTQALFMQALGAERIESLCNCFCEEIKTESEKRGYYTGARFSAGYGDLPLEVQRDIFSVLDCDKYIGVSLNGSLVMSPSKSVTAFVGILNE